jgi:hypothetical protein
MSAIYEKSNSQNDEYSDNFNIIYYEYECNKCSYTTQDPDPDCSICKKTGCMIAKETGLELDENTINCDICCENKDDDKYYIFRRGNKQELWSCIDCWISKKKQLHNELWKWSYYVDGVLDEEESDKSANGCDDAYMEEVKNLQKKYDIKTDKDGVIILPMGSADVNSEESDGN